MQRTLWLLALIFAISGSVLAQQPVLRQYTVATLPAASSNSGIAAYVKDGASPSDCAGGGGSYGVTCKSNGTAWDPVASISVNNVALMGVTANNAATDNTAALNAVFTAACSNHLPVYFPASANYYGTKPLNTITGCSITILGDGPGKSIIRAIGTNAVNNSLLTFSNTGAISNALTIQGIAFDGTNSGSGNNPNFEMAGITVNGYSSVSVDNASFSNFGTPGYSSTNGGSHTNQYDGLYVINGQTFTIHDAVASNNERAGIETQAMHYVFADSLWLAKNGEFGIVSEQNFYDLSGTVAGTTDGPLSVRVTNVTCSNNGAGCEDTETAASLPTVDVYLSNITASNDGYDPWGTAVNAGAPPTNGFEWDIALGANSKGTVANCQSTNFATSGTYTVAGQRNGIYLSTPKGAFTLRNNTVTGAGDSGIQINDAGGNVVSILGNVLSRNGKDGIYVYNTADGSSLAGNTMVGNGNYGLELSLGAGIVTAGNTAVGNTAGQLSITSTYGVSTPNYTGTSYAVRTVTSSADTATVGDYTVLDNAAANAITETLPASPATGFVLHIKKTDTTANAVTISGNGHNIDGAATQVLTQPYESIELQFDGSNWSIL